MIDRENQLTHITFEQLVDFHEGRLSVEDVDSIKAHLANGCQECRRDLAWLAEMHPLMRSDIWLQPPVDLRAKTRRIYREYYKPLEPRISVADRLISYLFPAPRYALVGATVLMLMVLTGLVVFILLGQNPYLSAYVAEVQGQVDVRPAGSDNWNPLREGMELGTSDQIRTWADSQAYLRFPDNSVTKMGEETQLSLQQLQKHQDGGQIVVLQQSIGYIWNYIQPQAPTGSTFEVLTPAATVAVKGTIFGVEVDQDRATHVEVEEGSVEVRGGGTSHIVQSGDRFTIRPNSLLSPETTSSSAETMLTCPTAQVIESYDACVALIEAGSETGEGPAGLATPTPTEVDGSSETRTSTASATAVSSPTPSPTPDLQETPTPTEPADTQALPTATPILPAATATPSGPTPPTSTATSPPPTSTATPPPPTATTPPPTSTPVPPTPTPTTPPPTPTPVPPTPTPTTPPPTPTPTSPPYPRQED